MAAPTVRSSNYNFGNTQTSSGPYSVTVPADCQSTDAVYVFLGFNGYTSRKTLITAPAGFNYQYGINSGTSSGSCESYVYTAPGTGLANTNLSFSLSSSPTSSYGWFIAVLVIAGGSVTPAGNTVVSAGSTLISSYPLSASTPNGSNYLGLGFWVTSSGAAGTAAASQSQPILNFYGGLGTTTSAPNSSSYGLGWTVGWGDSTTANTVTCSRTFRGGVGGQISVGPPVNYNKVGYGGTISGKGVVAATRGKKNGGTGRKAVTTATGTVKATRGVAKVSIGRGYLIANGLVKATRGTKQRFAPGTAALTANGLVQARQGVYSATKTGYGSNIIALGQVRAMAGIEGSYGYTTPIVGIGTVGGAQGVAHKNVIGYGSALTGVGQAKALRGSKYLGQGGLGSKLTAVALIRATGAGSDHSGQGTPVVGVGQLYGTGAGSHHSGTGTPVVGIALLRGLAGTAEDIPLTVTGHGYLSAIALLHATGDRPRSGQGALIGEAVLGNTGWAHDPDDDAKFYGQGEIIAIAVAGDARGTKEIGYDSDLDPLQSTAAFTQKGVTIAGGQGKLAVGTVLAKRDSDSKYVVVDLEDTDTTAVLLRTAVDATDDDVLANVIISGVIRLDMLSTESIQKLEPLGATVKPGLGSARI